MTTPSISPIMEDRAAQTFASPPCTACHLPHSSVSSIMKRGLCGSSRDLQHRIGPPHVLGSGLTGARAEAILADPGATVPDIAARVGATAPDAAGPILADPSAAVPDVAAAARATAAVSIVVVVAVVVTDAHPALAAATTVSVATTEAGVPVSAAATSVIAVGAPSVADALDTDASQAGSSSALSSRSITSLGGGTPGAAPCLAGSAAEAEGGTGVGSCPMPNYGIPHPVATAEAASAGGPVASPTTPPLTAGRVTACSAEVVDTRSAFFGASDGTNSLVALFFFLAVSLSFRFFCVSARRRFCRCRSASSSTGGHESTTRHLSDSLPDLGVGKGVRRKDGALGRRPGNHVVKRASSEHQRCHPPSVRRWMAAHPSHSVTNAAMC
uniref:Uncharacterized protein n=1 Tax=Setaria viridis TaxID=4556 RepID=A0A4U6TPH5_SETVI|nr:hypothetical protein SEVIR_7G010700v2 [Setaria viridis]